MATKQLSNIDMNSTSRIENLPNAVSAQEPATFAQLNAAIEGLAPKDSCRVATQANLNLASPGASIDGISMASSDRVLVRANTASAENGLYIWNGAAVAMTRSLDASTSDELEAAVVTIEEGTSAGVTYRQTSVNFVLNTGAVAFVVFGSTVVAASETSSGIAELATQAEVDAGTDDLRIVTPLKLATYSGRVKKFSQLIGDGSATQYDVTHNLNTVDAMIMVYLVSTGETVLVDAKRFSVNVARINFATAPASNAYKVVVIA